MRRKFKTAIQHKLIAIIMATCMAAIAVSSVVQVLHQRNAQYARAVNSISCYAHIIGDSCRGALESYDAETAADILQSLRAEPSIVFACMYDRDGGVLATHKNVHVEDAFSVPACEGERCWFEGSYLKIFERLREDDALIGTVFLQMDLRETDSQFWAEMRAVVLVAIAALGMAYLVSCKLQRIISAPVRELAEVARAVSEDEDYSRRAVKSSNDELGLFVDAFNDMLERIEHRERQLVEAKAELETKVEERTAELSAANSQLKEEIVRRAGVEASLQDMNDRLSESNRQLQEFTYVASHDLREPTRKITAFGQLLWESLKDKLDDDDRENLTFMVDGADRMQQMIEALLEYSRVTTKGVDFGPVDLDEIVRQLESVELAVMIEESNARINVPEPLGAVQGDPAQIRQLLQNLVCNAIKYRGEGVIPEITIRSIRQQNGRLRVEVQDNGIGIKREQTENVFVMFRRLHARSEYEGTGIGLAVCRKIVERHGGQIGVESVYGDGSTFWFTLSADGSGQPVRADDTHRVGAGCSTVE